MLTTCSKTSTDNNEFSIVHAGRFLFVYYKSIVEVKFDLEGESAFVRYNIEGSNNVQPIDYEKIPDNYEMITGDYIIVAKRRDDKGDLLKVTFGDVNGEDIWVKANKKKYKVKLIRNDYVDKVCGYMAGNSLEDSYLEAYEVTEEVRNINRTNLCAHSQTPTLDPIFNPCLLQEDQDIANEICKQNIHSCSNNDLYETCLLVVCSFYDADLSNPELQNYQCDYHQDVEEYCMEEHYYSYQPAIEDLNCQIECGLNEVWEYGADTCEKNNFDCFADCQGEETFKNMCICQDGFVRDSDTFACVSEDSCVPDLTDLIPGLVPDPSCHISLWSSGYNSLANFIGVNGAIVSDASTACDIFNTAGCQDITYPNHNLRGSYADSIMTSWTYTINISEVSPELSIFITYDISRDVLTIRRNLNGVMSDNLNYYSPQKLEFEGYVLQLNGANPYEIYFGESSSVCDNDHMTKLDFGGDFLKVEARCDVYDNSCKVEDTQCDTIEELAVESCHTDAAILEKCRVFLTQRSAYCLFDNDYWLSSCAQLICAPEVPGYSFNGDEERLCHLGMQLERECTHTLQPLYWLWRDNINNVNKCADYYPACGENMEWKNCGDNHLQSIYNCATEDDESGACLSEASQNACKLPGCYCSEGYIWDNFGCKLYEDTCKDPDLDPTPIWDKPCSMEPIILTPGDDYVQFDGAIVNSLEQSTNSAYSCYQTLFETCLPLNEERRNIKVEYKLSENSFGVSKYILKISYDNVRLILEPLQDIHIRSIEDGVNLIGEFRDDLGDYWYSHDRLSFTGSRNLGYILKFEVDYSEITIEYQAERISILMPCDLEGSVCDNKNILGNFNLNQSDDQIMSVDEFDSLCDTPVYDPLPGYDLTCHSREVHAIGDPHYQSFDSFVDSSVVPFPNDGYVDYMGTCRYIATKLCDRNDTTEATPWFNIVLDHQVRPDYDPSVTWITSNLIQYQAPGSNDLIEMFYDRKLGPHQMSIRVNKGYWNIFEDGVYPTFGIKKMFIDGNDVVYLNVHDQDWTDPANSYRVPEQFSVMIRMRDFVTAVSVTCEYKSKICGLFGNFDDQPDQLVKPDGTVIDVSGQDSSSIRESFKEFGDSWLYDDGTDNTVNTCEESISDPFDFSTCGDLSKYNEFCDFRKYADMAGFSECETSDDYYNALMMTCKLDMCAHEGNVDQQNEISCQFRQTYVNYCQSTGHQIFNVDDWRVTVGYGLPAFCPESCGINQEWVPNGSMCDIDYENCSDEDFVCQDIVEVPRCQCLIGYIWSGESCVPQERCPNTPDPNPVKEPVCRGKAYSLANQHHYTYDGFKTQCQAREGTLSTVCKNWEITETTPYFSLTGSPYKWEMTYQSSSMAESITIGFDFMDNNERPLIKLDKSSALINNDDNSGYRLDGDYIDINSPYAYEDFGIVTSGHYGNEIYFGVDRSEFNSQNPQQWNLKITFNSWHMLEIQTNCDYKTNLCGLYGNFNQIMSDDESFVPIDCEEPSINHCQGDADYEENIKGNSYCGIINDNVAFSNCRSPDAYKTCVSQLCRADPLEIDNHLCSYLSGFDSTCESAGRYVGPWRSPDFCSSLTACPTSLMEYSHNSPGCIATISNCNDNSCIIPGRQRCTCPSDKPNWNGYNCVDYCPPTGPELPLPTEKCSEMAIGAGDTHYFSFDGQQTDYQGHCQYQLSGLCNSTYDQGTIEAPWFRLSGRQQSKPEFQIPHVTFLHGWKMQWRPDPFSNVMYELVWDLESEKSKVQISKNGNNYVNLIAPYYYEEAQIFVPNSDSETIYFGMQSIDDTYNADQTYKIKFVWNDEHTVQLHLDCAYQGLVCGLMGTWDGDKSNDWQLPSGEILTKPAGENIPSNTDLWKETFNFGNAWLVDTDECPEDQTYINIELTCDDDIYSEEYCGRFKRDPFKQCGMDTDFMYSSCVYDLCAVDRDQWQTVLCNLLSAQEQKCNSAYKPVGNWREDANCPVICPSSQEFDHDSSATTVSTWTCQSSDDVASLYNLPNKAGCQCPSWAPYWNGNICVADCPDIPDEPTTPPNECFGQALIWGDAHYVSYDGLQTDMQGHCDYVASRICNLNDTSSTIDRPWFNVEVRQSAIEEWHIPYVTWVHGWNFKYIVPEGMPAAGQAITIVQDYDINAGYPQISLNGKNFVNLISPYYYEEYGIATTGLAGNDIYFGLTSLAEAQKADNHFKIRWQYDLDHKVVISLDCNYKNQVCGMLGNYDDDITNDWMLPNGDLFPRPAGENNPGNAPLWTATFEFADDWLAPDIGYCEKDHIYRNVTFDCNAEQWKEITGPNYCGILDEMPWYSCDHNREITRMACEYDLCIVGEDKWDEALCNILSGYADSCENNFQSVGSWRSDDFCGVVCPSGLVYSNDAPGCRLTTMNCQEGTQEECTRPNTQTCICPGDQPYYNNVLRTCQADCPVIGPEIPTPPIKCTGMGYGSGDVHYWTYDGHSYDYQGQCEYKMTGICDSYNVTTLPDNIPWFNVYVDQNYQFGDFEVSYVTGWRLEYQPSYSYDLVEIEFSKFENNGIPKISINKGNSSTMATSFNYEEYQIVTSSADSMKEIYLGTVLEDRSDYAIKIAYNLDHHLSVEVDCLFQGLLCGLLGDFDDSADNDLANPSGDITSLQGYDQSDWSIRKHHDYTEASFAYALEWKTDPICESPVVYITPCSAEKEELYKGDEWCGIISDQPFTSCGYSIQDQMNMCVFDVCRANNPQEALCQFLTSYEETCNSLSRPIGNWRPNVCPLSCEGGKVLTEEALGCEYDTSICNDVTLEEFVEDCSRPYKYRCACPPEKPIWDSFNQQCTDVCTQPDPPVEPECYSNYAMTLRNSYLTFDKHIIEYQNTCNLLLSKTDFTSDISAAEDMINYRLTFNPETRDFRLNIGIDYEFNRDMDVSVYNTSETNPLNLRFETGYDEDHLYKWIKLSHPDTDPDTFDIQIGYFVHVQELNLILECKYRGWVNGLFGNFDTLRDNDMSDPDNFVHTTFGSSSCEATFPVCEYHSKQECDATYNELFSGYDFNWRDGYKELFAHACECNDDLCPILEPFTHVVSYWTDDNTDEVLNFNLLETCPGDYCNSNEFFYRDGPGTCVLNFENCNDDLPLTCQDAADINPIPGCYCMEGFIRNLDGSCVPEDLCPPEEFTFDLNIDKPCCESPSIPSDRPPTVGNVNLIREITLNVEKPCCESPSIPSDRPPTVGNVIFTTNLKLNIEKPCCESETIPSNRPPHVGNVIFVDEGTPLDLNIETPCCETDKIPSNTAPEVNNVIFTEEEVPISLNIEKPCCETDKIPSDRPPTITEINFIWEDIEIAINIPKPCCENDKFPDYQTPGNVDFIDDVQTIDLNIEKPCCEHDKFPDYNTPGKIDIDVSSTIDLNIEKPCCEHDKFPDYVTPGDIDLDVSSTIDLNIEKPCCEHDRFPDYEHPGDVIFTEDEFEIILDLEKPCCEHDKYPDYVTPGDIDFNDPVIEFTLDVQKPCFDTDKFPDFQCPDNFIIDDEFEMELDIMKPCCDSEKYPDYTKPTEVEFSGKDLLLDIMKPCCDNDKFDDYQKPQEVLFDHLNMMLDIAPPCCETDKLPSSISPDVGNIIFNYGTFELDIERPCCESDKLPSDRPPPVGDLDINIGSNLLLDIEAPCCETNKLPSVTGPTISDLSITIGSSILLDVEAPCCESDKLPSATPPPFADIDLTLTSTIILDVEAPCCESEKLASANVPDDVPSEILLDWKLLLDVEAPCCESEKLASKMNTHGLDSQFDIVVTYDYSENLAGIPKSHTCCLDIFSNSQQNDPCENISSLHTKLVDANDVGQLCESNNRKRRSIIELERLAAADPWSDCSTYCGVGRMYRQLYNGEIEVKSCKVRDCEGYGKWSKWSSCQYESKTQSTFNSRTRICYGHAPCDGPSKQRRSGCAYSHPWTKWSTCTSTTKHTTRRRIGVNSKDKVEVELCAGIESPRNSIPKEPVNNSTYAYPPIHRRVKSQPEIVWTSKTSKFGSYLPEKSQYEYQISMGNYTYQQASDLCSSGDRQGFISNNDVAYHKDMADIVKNIRSSARGGLLEIINFWSGRYNSENDTCEQLSYMPVDAFIMKNNRNTTHTFVEMEKSFVPCQTLQSVKTTANVLCKSVLQAAWSPWSKCTKSCDTGEQFRSLSQKNQPTRFQSKECNKQPCESKCIEKDDLILSGTYFNKQNIHDCHMVSISDCQNHRVKQACPLTCKLEGCEKYWLGKDASTEEFISRNSKFSKVDLKSNL